METASLIDLIIIEHKICPSTKRTRHKGYYILMDCLCYSWISDFSLVLLSKIKSATHEGLVWLWAEKVVEIFRFFEKYNNRPSIFDLIDPFNYLISKTLLFDNLIIDFSFVVDTKGWRNQVLVVDIIFLLEHFLLVSR